MSSSRDFFRPSIAVTMRQAQAVLEERASPQATPPAVCWQGDVEDDDTFDSRVAIAREQLPEYAAVVAVCAPRPARRLGNVIWIELPRKLLRLLDPAAKARYRVAYGGRGSAKSWAFARALIARALMRLTRVLCGREYQNSLSESAHKLLCDQIAALGLDAWFSITQGAIVASNGSEVIFAGVRSNPTKIKSMEGIDIFWGEEAEKFSNESWQILIPTIRKPGSEIWATFNPDAVTDPTYERFVISPPPGGSVEFISWRDNPWFPPELEGERAYLERVDPDAYAWVWEGKCRAASNAQIFRGKFTVEGFEPMAGFDGPYFGCDFGFSQDPTTLVKCWIYERRLYVEHEAYAIGCDIDATPALLDQVPGARGRTIRADCARPETISYLQRHGYGAMQGVQKWSGSVEDGIAFLRSFEQIVLHPRCTHAAEEMRLYSFKIDRLTGDVTPEPLDKHNHIVDSLRYALQPLIRRTGMGFFDYLAEEAAKVRVARGHASP